MNSRSSVNESNLVNLSGDLTTLNQLDAKDSLALSFPFDHIYACHSDSSDRRPTHLGKEVEISSHSDDKDILGSTSSSFEVSRLSEKLTAAENQNKQLKSLLVYHLDLIQQQNELITKKEKQNTALKQENDTLKSKVNRMDKRVNVTQRHTINPAPIVHAPTTSIPSAIKSEPKTADTEIMFNSLTEFFLPDARSNSYIFNSDITKNKPYVPDPFDLKPSETEVSTYLPGDLSVSSLLDSTNLSCDNFGSMVQNKPTFANKKEIKTETRAEPMYTVTSNSGNTVIHKLQRNRKRASGSLGSLSRLPKIPPLKTEPAENVNPFDDDKSFERTFCVNKKSKMINTYGKSKTTTLPKKTPHFTGSLSDRLQLIDTTPTGEDPYQLGEADMREQSPIPKLMLQKSHGRLKICSDLMGENTIPSRRIYDAPVTETSIKMPNKIKLEKRYNLPNLIPYTMSQAATHTSTHTSSQAIHTSSHTLKPTHTATRTVTYTPIKVNPKPFHATEYKTLHTITDYKRPTGLIATSPLKISLSQQADADLLKKDNLINWRLYTPVRPLGKETSLCDFSYGENSNNLTNLPSINVSDFGQLLDAESAVAALENLEALDYEAAEKNINDNTKNKVIRTAGCLMAPGVVGVNCDNRRGFESKRGRKRALSTAGFIKNTKSNLSKAVGIKPKMVKGRGACRGKRPQVPGMMTKKMYHTLVGDPDLSWYLGLDPDVKLDDIDDGGDCKASTVEVPRWREMPFTSIYSLEGTENLDDRIFEKRHSKLEAEERRQLRWHMRRIREQRHLERLRMRQRDPWYSGNSHQPSVYTIWPQPQRDLRMIEITDELPVMAFGEEIPNLPPTDFVLSWVRSTKPMKRSKRSKTLH